MFSYFKSTENFWLQSLNLILGCANLFYVAWVAE